MTKIIEKLLNILLYRRHVFKTENNHVSCLTPNPITNKVYIEQTLKSNMQLKEAKLFVEKFKV